MIFIPRLDRLPLGLLRGIEAAEYPFSIPLLHFRVWSSSQFKEVSKQSNVPHQWAYSHNLPFDSCFSRVLMTKPGEMIAVWLGHSWRFPKRGWQTFFSVRFSTAVATNVGSSIFNRRCRCCGGQDQTRGRGRWDSLCRFLVVLDRHGVDGELWLIYLPEWSMTNIILLTLLQH